MRAGLGMGWLHGLIALALAGCAAVKPVKLPNGGSAYLVECGRAVAGKCAAKAAEVCPNGYDRLERRADRYTDLTEVGEVGALELKADTTERLLIQCR